MKISLRSLLFSILLSPVIYSQNAGTGKPLFVAKCAGCHGEDGTGGGLGPAILNVRNTRVTSRPALRDLIRKGIPEVGMPAFPMPDAELEVVIDYVYLIKTPATVPSTKPTLPLGAA